MSKYDLRAPERCYSPRIQNMRQICTLVMRVLAGLKEPLSRLSIFSSLVMSGYWSPFSRSSTVIGYVLSSRRNVAAASRIRKQMCDSVCVMNFEAGQRRALPSCQGDIK